jgi:hypothetical protein
MVFSSENFSHFIAFLEVGLLIGELKQVDKLLVQAQFSEKYLKK